MENALLKAFVAKCRETASITEALPGGVHHEPISASKNEEPLPAAVIYPYAGILCKPAEGRRREWSTGAQLVDYWDVVLSLYHPVKESLGNALAVLEAVFDAPNLYRSFVIDHASLVTLMRIETHAAISTPEKETRQGEDVHKTEKRWTFWLHRDFN